jgi:GntR family transcriptional regulator/MocR family aminotransferase
VPQDWPIGNVQFPSKLLGQLVVMALDALAQARISQRICKAIKGQITSAVLGPGAWLPSTRSLAAEWGVSRTTVTAAYEQLAAEGYLVTQQGSRTRVAQGLGSPPVSLRQAALRQSSGRLSQYGQRLSGFDLLPAPGAARLVADFRYGDLATADFPLLAWKKAVTTALLRQQPRLQYGDPCGLPRLRAALQGYLWRARGLRCEPDQVVVVNGSQQGLDLCTRLLLDPGDRVVMENPGYILARQVFLAAGAELIPRDVDAEGMQTQGLPNARVAYVTPSHQYPLGSVMSAGRRRELLAWAQSAGAYVIEDDYDSEYRFDIGPIPPLQALDDAERVIYLGTVSKTLSPTLRLGYFVVPTALSTVFAKAKGLTDRHSASLEQEALANLIESGAYERHVRRVRRRNGERRATLLAALSAALGDAATVVGADAGLHVVIWLDRVPRAREAALVARAHLAGLGVYPVTPLYAPALAAVRPNTAGLVMGYASLGEETIERGVWTLREVLKTFV